MRAQEDRIEGFQHQAAVHQRQRQHAGSGHACHQQQAAGVDSQRAAKQDVQQIQLGAVPGNQRDAQCQRDQVDGGQACIFLEGGEAAHRTGHASHQHARQHTAERHGRE